MSDLQLRITEIFRSLQGEARSLGWPTVFIRLTGCPLRCSYCDTAYAFSGGQRRSLDGVLEDVRSHATRHVCVTGGEPLAQAACLPLLERLCDEGYEVSLETSGALDMSAVDARVSRVMDLKTPASGEVGKNNYANLALLTRHDQLKFVICDRGDYDWACRQIAQHDLTARCEVLFSPAHGLMEPAPLADWLLADGLEARFQMQLHKLLWGEAQGR